ncbi:S-layer homology domain-containing protein [Tindallia magadiensis]|uniref:S-layer homology domain-containing protein n=1 Tax=Tindallia magadiensis TaxID=69895 RepID=A0A1I3D1E2_9FIRM|nr:S-layer homology domain-containing protein [Tindallia magadiensis]SFH80532.1 S-layer homology domain-containing protein [Tindallia magadiensis]
MKKKATIALAFIMLFTSMVPAFAVEFTDISGHWGRNHIQRMADKGIVSGSEDPNTGRRVYKPDDPVTKVEAIVMLYSMLRETEQLISQNDHTSRYRSIMTSADIPEWAMRQVAYAIEAEIISTTDLAGFMKDAEPSPEQQSAAREEVAIYFGKAMDTEEEADRTATSLDFKDTEQISSNALPYVNLLVEKDVISGDTENNFNPRQTITRAEMAALLSKAVEALEDSDPIVIQLPDREDEDEDEDEDDDERDDDRRNWTRKEGEIQRVNTDTGLIYITFEDEDDVELYKVDRNTEILIRSIEHELISLKRDMKGEFTINERDELIRIDIEPRRSRFTGYLRVITDLSTHYAIVVESRGDSDNRRSFRITDDSEIIIDGSSSRASRLEKDELVTVEYNDLDVIRIENDYDDGRDDEVEGILEGPVSFSSYPYTIQVRKHNRRSEEYKLDDNPTVRVDNRRGYLEDLSRGDIVEMELNRDGYVTRIDAISFDRETKYEGTIQQITLGRTDTITIMDDDREERTFELAEGVDVFIDNDRSSLSDLRVNAKVELHLEGGRVVEIEADRLPRSDRVLQGTIDRLDDRRDILTLEHISQQTDRYIKTSVYVTRDTVIVGRDNRNIDFTRLRRDDEVLINGHYSNNDFIADRIFVID